MSIRIAFLLVFFWCSFAHAAKISSEDLLGVWEAQFVSAHKDSMLGQVKWIQISFLPDDQVEWTWEREGKNEYHKGKYSVSVTPSKEGAHQTSDISILPTTMAVYRKIPLAKATIDYDNRFPLPKKVLKCNDFDGNPLVFGLQENKQK